MAKAKVTAADVLDALRHDYGVGLDAMGGGEWSMLAEMPLSAMEMRSWGGGALYPGRNERTIDAMLFRNWGGTKSEQFERLAIEVKVSKSDYKNETDAKRAPAWANAHRCAYACPPEIITVDQLPEGWGLLWVYPEPISDVKPTHRDFGRRCSWRRGATRHEPTDGDPVRLLHNVARRAWRAEERIRTGECSAAEMAAMRLEVDRLHARLANRDRAVMRQRERTREALQRLRALGEQCCADCHEVVKANLDRSRYDAHEDGFWKHADKDAGDRCRMARSEAARLAREQATQTRYTHYRDYAPPIETESEREERLRETEVSVAEDAAHDALTTDEDHREEARYG